MPNKFRYSADEHHVDSAAGALTSGDIVVLNSKAWQLQGLKDVVVGDPYTVKKNLVVEVEKTSAATVIAAWDTVGFDVATQKTVAGGAGDIDLKARKASANGDATVLIELPA